MSTNDPDQIREEIERTRANLSYDVNALADEANPKNVAQRQADKAVEGVRSGIRNVKERIMGSDDSYDQRYDQYGRDPYGHEDRSVTDRARDAASDAKETVGEKVDDARHFVSDKAGDARQAAQQAPREVRSQVRGNPLAAGLIAFGVGSLIGSLFPATRYESRAADTIKDKAQPVVDEVKDLAKDAVDQVKPAAQGAVDQVKQAAQDAKDNVADQAEAAKDNTVHQAQDAKDNVQYVHDQDKNNQF